MGRPPSIQANQGLTEGNVKPFESVNEERDTSVVIILLTCLASTTRSG